MTTEVEIVSVQVPKAEWDALRAGLAELQQGMAAVLALLTVDPDEEHEQMRGPAGTLAGFARYRQGRSANV